MKGIGRAVRAAAAVAAAVAAHDLVQRDHAILRNFPLVGRARRLLESIGPELRQYIVAANNEERPFTRDQRRWVYASAKNQNNYFGFGTDNDIEYTAGYPIIKHRTFGRAVPPSAPMAGHEVEVPCAKVLGAARGRRHAFRPTSLINISAMSFGSLSGNAIEALNRGAALAGCLHRSAPRTSAAATSGAGSTSTASRTWSPRHRYGHWRSSSARAPSPASVACCPGRRSPPRSPRSGAYRQELTA